MVPSWDTHFSNLVSRLYYRLVHLCDLRSLGFGKFDLLGLLLRDEVNRVCPLDDREIVRLVKSYVLPLIPL